LADLLDELAGRSVDSATVADFAELVDSVEQILDYQTVARSHVPSSFLSNCS